MIGTGLVPAANPSLFQIEVYVPGAARAPGFDDPAKLSSNENPLGTSAQAQAAFTAAADGLHRYPDGGSQALRAAIAARFGLDPARIVCTSGSDEILGLLATAYLAPGDNTVQGEYSYLTYRIVAHAAGAEPRLVAEPGYTVDPEAILAAVDARTRIVFIANPGNPTGTHLSGAAIRALHARLPGDVILVLDGAYAEYVEDPAYEDGLALAREADNVVVVRTFSKIHGLAALRVGWSYLPAGIADAIMRIRPPFNVNAPAQQAATASLADEAFLEESRTHAIAERARLGAALRALGLTVLPSQTNFVMLDLSGHPRFDGAALVAALAAQGILVRGLGGYGLDHAVRVSIGTVAENDLVIGALARLFEPENQVG